MRRGTVLRLMLAVTLAAASLAPAAAGDSVYRTVGSGNDGRVIDAFEKPARNVFGTVTKTASQKREGSGGIGYDRPALFLENLEPKKIRVGTVKHSASEQRQLPGFVYRTGKPYRYAAEMAAPVTVFITVMHRGQKGLADAIGDTRAEGLPK